jgi:hypothetical protein
MGFAMRLTNKWWVSNSRLVTLAIVSAIWVASCSNSTTAPCPGAGGTYILRQTVTETINAVTSRVCSRAFQLSVDPAYYAGGSQRCIAVSGRSETGGMVIGDLRWQDSRIDLDLVLNDGVQRNFRQSIAANRCCEHIEFVVNGCTDYVFIVYLRGVDAQFLANGGSFTEEIATPFTLTVERPQ